LLRALVGPSIAALFQEGKLKGVAAEVATRGNRVTQRRPDYARVALGLIRLANGAAALVAPAFLLRRLAVDPQTEPAASYPLRLFGIRTVLIGADLLLNRPQARADALRVAPIIHASDLMAAAIAAVRGELPRRAALTTALISTLNVALAIAAQPRTKDRPA